ncbi:MAG: ribonuclease HI [Prevotellaceae bacterium]|jgi:ribonuclease HI|nr:ribonuclease HI [Prevotellaceae bacterium]
MSKVVMFTDGACSNNPGAGGYGVVLISGTHRKELSQGYALTTNNRMELLAIIVGLEALTVAGCEVTVYTDSRYVVDAVEQRWVFAWAATPNFKGKKNRDLWLRFLRVYGKHSVHFVWVKGHAGNLNNERCDRLAVAAAAQPNLLPDKGFVQENLMFKI